MANFIEFQPERSTTKTTKFVRIDGDFKFTLVIDDNGTLTTVYKNYSGLADEQVYTPPSDDNVVQVRLAKDGSEEAFTARIRMFYPETATEDAVPQAFIYGAPITKDTYKPTLTLPASSVQSFPIEIWNRLAQGEAKPGANTSAVIANLGERLYAQLGTLAERRSHLKLELQTDVYSREMPIWLIENSAEEQSAFVRRLEMLTRALSSDANLNTEAKFNLLAGEIGLDAYTVATHISSGIVSGGGVGQLHSDNRDNWQFFRLGAIGTGPAFPYSPPSTTNYIAYTSDVAGITLSGVSAAVSANDGRGWLDWLRTD